MQGDPDADVSLYADCCFSKDDTVAQAQSPVCIDRSMGICACLNMHRSIQEQCGSS